VSDEEGMDDVSVSWSSDRDGSVGGRSSWTSVSRLSEGLHEITCTADDGDFRVSDTVTVEVLNEAPSIEIEQPLDLARYFAGESIPVSANAVDRNGNLSGVTWELRSIIMVSPHPFADPIPLPFTHWTGSGVGGTIPGGLLSPGTYDLIATASDTRGESASDAIEVIIEPDPLDRRPSISDPTVTATPVDSNDGPPAYFWEDRCLVDVTGDGVVNHMDGCQRLRFRADVSDDHDALSALNYEWVISESGTVIDIRTTSSANLTLDLVVGTYQVTLTVTDSGGNTSIPYTWSFRVDTLI
jgi:hypothetical protein